MRRGSLCRTKVHVASGTSLNITGAGPGAVADGGGSTRLFVVDVVPTCEVVLKHTTAAEEPGLTLKTVNIEAGYWRTTTESGDILACYNPDSCMAGLTGADSFGASGFKGPCEGGVRGRAVSLFFAFRNLRVTTRSIVYLS